MQTQTPITYMVMDPRRAVESGSRAAGEMMKLDRAHGWSTLNGIFREGTPPRPPLQGKYPGELVALALKPGLTQFLGALASSWLPWKGKRFNAAQAYGDNIFTRGSLTPWPSCLATGGSWKGGTLTARVWRRKKRLSSNHTRRYAS